MSETFCPRCGGLHNLGPNSCPAIPLAGLTLPDGLQVRESLCKGALGDVYLAEYPDTQVEVELVILHTEFWRSGPTAEAVRLRDQLQGAARLEHPNIAGVRSMGETENGAVWVAFEMCRGELLSEILDAGTLLPPQEAIDLVLQAASGLRAAHEVGLVHGNLSPDTILVTRTAEDRPRVKLIRFGLAQHGAEPSGGGGGGQGHAWSTRYPYASPEQLAGYSPDERSDVFSLGAVLQHLLTGEPPSPGQLEVLRIPEAERRVIAKALEPPPDDRFQTVAAFARALASATSRPPARIRSRSQRTRRRRGFLAVALLIAVAAVWLWGGRERFLHRQAGDGIAAGREPMTTGEIRAPPSPAVDSTPMLLPESLPGSAGTAAADSMLVDVRSVDSTIQVDLRYATANNFTGAPLPGYEGTRALLRREAAAALGRVQAKLRGKGLGLRVFDAYRPVRASLAMVDWAERVGNRALLESGYIAGRSRHNLGGAVDVSLVDLKTGTEVPMGTTFDDFTSGDARLSNASGEAARNRQVLVQAMESEGFSPYDQAWWHFNYPLKQAVPLDRVIR